VFAFLCVSEFDISPAGIPTVGLVRASHKHTHTRTQAAHFTKFNMAPTNRRRWLPAMGLGLLLVGMLAIGEVGAAVSASLCECSSIIDSRFHHMHFRNKQVEFYDGTEDAGDTFVRTATPAGKHKPRPSLFGANNEDLSPYCDAEQIHINLGGDGYGSVIFSFVTTNVNISTDSAVYVSTDASLLQQSFADLAVDKRVSVAEGSSLAFSENLFVHGFVFAPQMGEPLQTSSQIASIENTSYFAYDHKTGKHWANWLKVFGDAPISENLMAYNNPNTYYDSPVIHTATLSSLMTGTTYYYRVSGSCLIYHFVIPAQNRYPMTVALTGDLGQTEVSERSIAAMAALKPDFALLVGDLSYADGFVSLWDNFGRLIEPFAAETAILTTAGNHEVMYGENTVSYKYRWPSPYEGSGSAHYCYWGREVGVVHVIALCSYAGYQKGSLQYTWLQRYLATQIDRERTPWLIAMIHTPFYNSNSGHWMEGELMRIAFEPLLYAAGVDIVLSGHVHSYERSKPVYNFTADECGMTYLNLGDGGNYEGTYGDWFTDDATHTQPQSWSEFREASFGIGGLQILDSITANYSWHRHACSSDDASSYNMNFSEYCSSPTDTSSLKFLTSDSILIKRPSKSSCPNRYVSTAVVVDDSDNSLSSTGVALIALSATVGVLSILLIGLIVKLYSVNKSYSALKPSTVVSTTNNALSYKLLSNAVANEEMSA
jgi:hypothetical protein